MWKTAAILSKRYNQMLSFFLNLVIFEPVVRFYKGFKDLIFLSMFQKTKFSRNWSTILLWPIKQKMFLRALGRALYYFFSPKMLVLVRLGWLLMGGAKKRNFPGCIKGAADAAREPRMQLWSRGCSYWGADAFRDPPAVPPSCTAVTLSYQNNIFFIFWHDFET